VLGTVAADLPFAIVPIVLASARIEPSVIRASQDRGAGFWTTFRRVVLPLIMPGVVSCFLFVLVVAIGASSEIQLLGGAGASSISIMINDVMRVLNFPLAFVISADMIFAGGYGHSRLPEAPMGGATRTLLGSMTAPVLMTH